MKKFNFIVAMFILATATVITVNVSAISRQNKELANWQTLISSDIEGLANDETSPDYKGARNQYCEKPENAIGCVKDPDQSYVCTSGVFCTKP